MTTTKNLREIESTTLTVAALADALATDGYLGERKILAIKILRSATGLGLKESKDAIDAAHARLAVRQYDVEMEVVKVRLVSAAFDGDESYLLAQATRLRNLRMLRADADAIARP